MTEPEVQRAAEFLAAHAVLLLGLAILAALAAMSVVIGAVHVLRRFRDAIHSGFAIVLAYLQRFHAFERTRTLSITLLPSAYLTLHLVLGLALTAAISVFGVIAEDVMGGGAIATFDLTFAQALRDAASPGIERFFAVVSWLGERQVIAVATVAVAVRLVRTHNVRTAVLWIAGQAGGGVLNLALKEAFERTRPSFADPLLAASSWSFPSGHAMGTFILFGLGCYVFLRDVRSWTKAAVLVTLSLSWCIVMAFSRLYLGVHFASDVAAGVIAGVAWVAVCASAFEVIRRRRDVKAR